MNVESKVKGKERNSKGITLIALVVTIVILIILATISISALFGENGLIKKAQEARDHQSNAVAMEQSEMDKLADEYANLLEEGNGGETPEDPTADWDTGKVQKVTSDDNVIVPVPIGYTKSTVSGEGSVNTGFVIKEGDNGATTEGINEFVWVPVEDINDLYDATNNAGQLWDFGNGSDGWKNPAVEMEYPTIQSSGFREPDVVTWPDYDHEGSESTAGNAYDAISSNLQMAGLSPTATALDFKVQLQTEFEEMKNSVEKYGGFYIGRYETGNLSQTKAVVQKNNTDIQEQTWSWYVTYRLNKTIAANTNVKTSLIWGCQWDATLRWMQNDGVTEEIKKFPTDSRDKGNYFSTNWRKSNSSRLKSKLCSK